MTVEQIRPKTLFRYFGNTKRDRSNLSQRCLYFNSPSRFNDPFDSALWPIIIPPSPVEAVAIDVKFMTTRDGLPPAILKEYLATPKEDSPLRLCKMAERHIELARTTFLKESGIICLTRCPRNLLMWAHYADSHRGFCLEFNGADAFFKKLKPVKYSAHVPEFHIGKFYLHDDDIEYEKFFQIFCTKSKDWEYEQEWRLFHHKQEASPFLPSMLNAIYLGTRISNTDTQRLIGIAKTWETPLKIFKGHLSRTEFTVDFEECTTWR